jgi:hypothetical protein
MLLTVHVAAAGVLKTPELALDPSEAKSLAKALDDVNRAFPTNVDPRLVVVLNATAVAAMIYGPRFVTIADRMKRERKEGRQRADVMSPGGGVEGATDFSVIQTFNPPPPAAPPEPPFATSQN